MMKKLTRLFILTAMFACILALGVFASQKGVITGDIVNVRKGPGTSYEVVETLAAGREVSVLGEEAGWYQIQWNNSNGYVLRDYVALNGSSSKSANATVTGGTINVRSGPGTENSRVTLVAEGKRVTVLNKEGDWYYVMVEDQTGYIYCEFLLLDGDSEPVAASKAPASSSQSSKSTTGNATISGGDTINVRTGPGTGYNRVTVIGEGKRVTILAEEGGWFKISFDGQTGYILGDYVKPDSGVLSSLVAAETPAPKAAEPIPAAEVSAVTVVADTTVCYGDEDKHSAYITGGTINVRSGPGTEYGRVTQLRTGKEITVIGEDNGWLLIAFGDSTGYVRGDFISNTEPPTPSGIGEQIAEMVVQYLGVPYVYGGESPRGFDCSGLTMYLYRQFGYSLPHSASGQYANCGYKVSRSDLMPGDIVFFSSPGSGGAINHCAIYIGGGEIIHARYSVGQVYRNSLYENYYSTYYAGAIRIA